MPQPSHPVVPGSTRLAFGLGASSIIFIGFGLGAFISQCYKENPYTKRRQFVFMPRQIENFMGNMIAQQYRAQYKYVKNTKDEEIENYLQKVISHVILPHKTYKPDEWQINIIHSEEVNACAIAGGNIFVNTGFLKYCQNADEVAFVLGHEFSHVEGRHMAERLSVLVPIIFLAYALAFYLTNSNDYDWVVKMGIKYLVELPQSRFYEYEADKMSAGLCKRSGFDPVRAADFFKRSHHKNLEFMATHPLDENRITKIEEEVKMVYDIPDQKTIEIVKDLHNKFLGLAQLAKT